MDADLLALLTPEEREAWEISQKATKDWEYWDGEGDMGHIACSYEAERPPHGRELFKVLGDNAQQAINAQFAVKSRTGYPAALMTVAALRRKVQELEKESAFYSKHVTTLPTGTAVNLGVVSHAVEQGFTVEPIVVGALIAELRSAETKAKELAEELDVTVAGRDRQQERIEAAERKVADLGRELELLKAEYKTECGTSDHLDKKLEAAEARNAEMERDGWVSAEERLPELSGGDICIRLTDGSELHSAILQSDGDYWWQERFFDPSVVTHWRPTAEAGAQEQGGGR